MCFWRFKPPYTINFRHRDTPGNNVLSNESVSVYAYRCRAYLLLFSSLSVIGPKIDDDGGADTRTLCGDNDDSRNNNS